MDTFVYSIIVTQEMASKVKNRVQLLGKLVQNLQKRGQNILFLKPNLFLRSYFYNISGMGCENQFIDFIMECKFKEPDLEKISAQI